MKRFFGILWFTLLFVTVLSGCEKKELLKQKTVYGKATINDRVLYQYTTIGETLSNQYWFLPLELGNHFVVKEGVCYLQLFLRDSEETEAENFWLILIGCHADEHFPILGKEYELVVQRQVNLGTLYNSFYWSGELGEFYSGNSEFASYGIAGLSIPPAHDAFIPLEGSMQFLKGDSQADAYAISYNLKSEDDTTGTTYRITGEFHGKLKMVD